MVINMHTRKLYNGVEIPAIFYGPGILQDYRSQFFQSIKQGDISLHTIQSIWKNKSTESVIHNALSNGCCGFDTSAAYGDAEKIIGKQLSHVARKKVFLATKISNKQQLKKNVSRVYKDTLDTLGMKYVDLYFIHWPQPGYLDTWKQMEELYLAGKIKAIGVCNFQINHLEELMKIAQVKPMVNQFEVHPLFTQEKLCSYCTENQIQVMSYTPVARCDDRLMNSSALKQIAMKHKCSIIQVLLRWHIQKGYIPVVRSNNTKHLKANFDIFHFHLNENEMRIIDQMNLNSRLRYDSNHCNFKDL